MSLGAQVIPGWPLGVQVLPQWALGAQVFPGWVLGAQVLFEWALGAQVFPGWPLGAQDALLCSPPHPGLVQLLALEFKSPVSHTGVKNAQCFTTTHINLSSGTKETFTLNETGENGVTRSKKTLGLRSRQISEGKEGIRMQRQLLTISYRQTDATPVSQQWSTRKPPLSTFLPVPQFSLLSMMLY